MIKQAIIAVSLVLVMGIGGLAQDEPAKQLTPELMEEMMQLAKPGPEHELLATYAGHWDAEVTWWMEPGAEPQTAGGSQTSEMILEGRFLKSDGEMGEGMMSGTSLTIMGFDRRVGEYTMVAFDTWGTYYVTAGGTYNEENKTIIMTGEEYDPLMDFMQEYYFKLTLIDEDTYVSELYFTDEVMTQGKGEFLMVRTTYTRAESGKE